MKTSDLVREMRHLSGRTLRHFAYEGGTSDATLSSYETGRVEPRLSTLKRLAEANGLEIDVTVRRRLTSADRRALAVGQAVARRLLRSPENVIEQAKRNLGVIRSVDVGGHSRKATEAWDRVLEQSPEEIAAVLIDPGPGGCSLRKSTPFASVLSPDEYHRVLEDLDRGARA